MLGLRTVFTIALLATFTVAPSVGAQGTQAAPRVALALAPAEFATGEPRLTSAV